MDTQFDRKWEVSFGIPGVQQFTTSELRISFEAVRTITSEANQCQLTITNLAKDSLSFIKPYDSICTLKAGYKNPSLLFQGFVKTVHTYPAGPDRHTDMLIVDGLSSFKDKASSVSYAKDTPWDKIVADAIKELNLPEATTKKAVAKLSELASKSKGNYAHTGSPTNRLDQILGSLGYQWSIQNNNLSIVAVGETSKNSVFRITDYVLTDVPQPTADVDMGKGKGGKKKKGSPAVYGWKLPTFLLPEALPGDKVIVDTESVAINGEFKIIQAAHAGDSHGNPWNTTLEVLPI